MNSANFYAPFTYRKRISANDSVINTLEFSPKGDFLATGGDDSKVFLISANLGDKIKKESFNTPHIDSIITIDYFKETALYTGGTSGLVCLFDLERLICLGGYTVGESCSKLSVSKDYNLVAASTSRNVLLNDISSDCIIHKFSALEPRLAFRPGTSEFVLGTADHTLQLFDLRDLSKPLDFFDYSCYDLSRIDSFSIDSFLSLRNYKLSRRPTKIVDCVFNTNGSLLLITEHGSGPAIYRPDRSMKRAVFSGCRAKNVVTFKSFRFGGPNDSFVLAGFDDKTLKYWSLSQNYTSENSVIERCFLSDHYVRFKCKESTVIDGFRSIINTAVMHPRLPIIYSAGVENAVYAFSPYPIGSDDKIEPNLEAIVYTDTWLDEVYGRSMYAAAT